MRLIEKHRVITYPEYFSDLDEFEDDNGKQWLLMHVEAEPKLFNKTIMQRMIAEFALLQQCVMAPIFVMEPNPDDRKWERFVTLLGFHNTQMRVACSDGHERRLFVNKKNNGNEQHKDFRTIDAAVGCTNPVPTAGVSGSVRRS